MKKQAKGSRTPWHPVEFYFMAVRCGFFTSKNFHLLPYNSSGVDGNDSDILSLLPGFHLFSCFAILPLWSSRQSTPASFLFLSWESPQCRLAVRTWGSYLRHIHCVPPPPAPRFVPSWLCDTRQSSWPLCAHNSLTSTMGTLIVSTS